MSHYFELRLKPVCDQDLELGLSEILFEHGCEGISESLPFLQDLSSSFDTPTLLPADQGEMVAYFSQTPTEDLFVALKRMFPLIQVSAEKKENQDWNEGWKKSFERFVFADDVWVVPSWDNEPLPDRSIVLNLGMAFGSGTHETTQLAARLIPDLAGLNAVDLGCGSGILSFFMAKHRRAQSVLAVDNDLECLRVTEENIALNPDCNIRTLVSLSDLKEGELDFIVANIIDGVLTALSSDIFRLLKTNGQVVFSGILKEREALFWSTVQDRFEKLETCELGEWVAIRARVLK